MMWNRIIWLFILFLLGKHICFPTSPRYLELADSADYYMARENWDMAEMKIIEAMRLEPANFTNSLLLANLGIVRTNKGEYRKALESLSMGLNMAPNSTVLLNNRAHTYLLIDSIRNAEKDLDKSLSIDSLQEWTLQTRAFLCLDDNNFDKAEKLFNKLKKDFPGNSKSLTGLALIEENKGNYEAARSLYSEAIKKIPEDEEVRESYIYLLIKTDCYSEARAQIKEAMELNPENPMLYLLRGYLHRLNYRMEEAKADKNIALTKGIDKNLADSFIP